MKSIVFITILMMLSMLPVAMLSCRKFVTVDAPVTQLVTASVFNNNTSAISAQTSIYAQMSDESYYLSENTGLLGDELIDYTKSGSNAMCYTNLMDPSANIGPWQSAYNYIHQANAVLEGLQNENGVSSKVKSQLEGEAKFIRAFWHFYLVNCYGDVPLILTTNYVTNSHAARSPRTQVYRQIITDLNDAKSNLSLNYLDGSDTVITSERVRPTKWAASALLARVYLYTNNYDSAVMEASVVINNSSIFKLESDLSKVFWKNSKEAIWQLAIPLPTTRNTYDGFLYILRANPDNVALSGSLVNSFEIGDLRKNNWVGYFTSFGIDTFYFPYKYKVWSATSTSPDSSEYVMVFRLAELYLIRAESLAHLGDIPNSLNDLDTIRERAGLSQYQGSKDLSSVLEAIIHERKIELFTEWGHRWFDMIRTKVINNVMGSPGNVAQSKGGQWNNDGRQTLYPIWTSEIGSDPNLTQNPGY